MSSEAPTAREGRWLRDTAPDNDETRCSCFRLVEPSGPHGWIRRLPDACLPSVSLEASLLHRGDINDFVYMTDVHCVMKRLLQALMQEKPHQICLSARPAFGAIVLDG